MGKQDRFPLSARVRIVNGPFQERLGMIMGYRNENGRTLLSVRLEMEVDRENVAPEDIVITSPKCQKCGEEYILNSGDYLCNTCRWHLDKVQTLHSSAESV